MPRPAAIPLLVRMICLSLSLCCLSPHTVQAEEAERTEPLRLTGQKYPILRASFSADGKRIALLASKNVKSEEYGVGWSIGGETGKTGWQMVVWDVPGKKELQSLNFEDLPEEPIQVRPGQFPEVPSYPYQLGFSGNGEMVILAGMGPKAQVFDVKSGKLLPPLLTMAKNSPFAIMGVSQMAVSPDGKLMAACRQEGLFKVLQLYDPVRRRAGRVLHGKLKMGDLQLLAFSPDGNYLVGTGYGTQIMIWDMKTGRVKNIDTSPVHVDHAWLSDDGESVVTYSKSAEAIFSTWDLKTGKLIHSAGKNAPAKLDENAQPWFGSSSFSADGSRFARINEQRQVLVFDVKSGELLQTVEPTKQKPLCVAFSPDGKTLATGGYEDHDLLLWEISPPGE